MFLKNSLLTAFLILISSFAFAQDDCEVEVTFVWTLDSDWCESWCKIENSVGNLVAGYFSACQNQGCAVCDLDDLYGWTGQSMDAVLDNGNYVITQTITLPDGEYSVEMHDGYGDGWSDNSTGGIDAFIISGNIDYSIDFANGFTTTGQFTLSCEPGEGCTDEIACNYDSNAVIDDGSCLYFDECGICDGSGIPDGDCDCLGNVLDAIGDCGGDCTVDFDGDGICDDCPGDLDECGVCNGPGAIYGCGCTEIPEGDCDCEGNVLDALGECGGDCDLDLNNNGVCDDEEVSGCSDPTACNYNAATTSDDGSCEYCSCIGDEDYTLTIEAYQPYAVDGITYRFYVNMVNPTDHMSAVFGHDALPLIVNTPEGAFNTELNSSWSATGLNPNFFPIFPELVDDSYATIGLDVPALMSGISGAENPTLVEDVSQPLTNFFMTPLAEAINVSTVYGASYFVTNGAANGLPDGNNRVLVMQVTTTGEINGTLNYQIFPEGIGSNEIIRTVHFNGAGTYGEGGGSDICGCIDPVACNFNSASLYDNGSCLFFDECGICDGPGAIYECGCSEIIPGECDCDGNVLDELGDCGGDCLEDLDDDGICDDVDDCVGEIDACGVCNGPGEIYECGCADIPDGDCDCEGNVLDALGECGGDCGADIDEDGICDDVDDCVGAFDECGVCNGPGEIYECGCADIPDGECDCVGNVLDALGDCGGDCDADLDDDGICDDVDDCVGAFDECGVCNGPGEIYECGCEDIPEGDCDCNGNVLDALGDCGGDCDADLDDDGICDDVDDCVGELDACGVCNGPGDIYECGCADIPEGDCNCDGNVLDALGDCGGDCLEDIDGDGICDDVDDCVGELDACGVCNGPGAVYECGCADIPDGDCDCEGNVLDALGECGGNCDADLDDDGICDDVDDCVGAFDECGVCNGPGEIYECGCEDIPDGQCDCEGNVLDALGECGGDCLEDLDDDGICDDVDDCVGAFDECGVCNGPGAIYECGCEDIPEGDCDCYGNVLDALGECGGDCLEDLDDDGICDDVDDCVGEIDACGVCNGPGEIYECGCADIPDGDCDCEGNVLDALGECGGDCGADIDEDGICDDVDDCVGAFDECGVCNGPGEIYECGCEDIPDGECDCVGNVLDALGDCGGDCDADLDDDGICDDVDDCVGAFDECGVCNGPGEIYECGCEDIPEGDCDCNGNVLDALGDCGGDCDADLDDDGICDDVDDCVGELDACGVCNGPGDIYECGCADIPEGDCNCDGNVLDALGDCGGDCLEDIDGDGICDDVDDCVGELDACGVCNGPGAVYECGCADIPDGDCDCEGNVLDALGECGGNCDADLDDDGICDDVDDCVGAFDECGVCNGPGEIYECGCEDIPDGQCDCEGNVLDALGECGGDCDADLDDDGICDDVDDCVGAFDECGVCNGPGEVYECGCEDIPEGDCDCDGNVLDALGECGGDCEYDLDEDGVCDTEEVFGCTDNLACNYDPLSTEENGTCTYDCYGCTDSTACNFDVEALFNDGSCIMPGDPCDDGLVYTEGDFLQSDCSCNGYGCTDPDACNYVAEALTDNSLCSYIGNYSITGALSANTDMIVEYSYPNTTGSTYEWIIFNGDVTNGEGTSSIEVVWWGDFEGQLCVIESNYDSCSGNMACINVNIINSVHELFGVELNLYPNPARDVLNVELLGLNHITVVDVVGRMVWHDEIIDKGQIDLTKFERGTYILNAMVDGIVISKRFIIH